MDASLVVELWNKGMLWDKLVGCALIPLQVSVRLTECFCRALSFRSLAAESISSKRPSFSSTQQGIQYSAEPSEGVWLTLDAEFINSTDGHPQGTKTPTGHQMLIEAHFELPYGMDGFNSAAICGNSYFVCDQRC